MTAQPPSPEAAESANLKWESDTEVIGIYKFPCVKNRNGSGVILIGRPDTEVQQLAHLHNQAIDHLAAEVERLRPCYGCGERFHPDDMHTIDIEKYGEHDTAEICDGCKEGQADTPRITDIDLNALNLDENSEIDRGVR